MEDLRVVDHAIYKACRKSASNVEGVLQAAADLIEAEGHVKGELMTGAGFCAEGAIHQVCGTLYGYQTPRSVGAVNHFCDYLGIGRMELAKWNDRPWRRKATVVAKLRKAAKASRPEWFRH